MDRGSVQVLTKDGVRRIPRAELERTGLWPGAHADAPAELQRLQAENEQLRGELRALPAQVDAECQARERAEAAFHQARAEQQTVEHAGERACQERDELNAQLREITSAGPIRALRLRRRLRAERAA